MRELAETFGDGDKHHPNHARFFVKARKFWDGVVRKSDSEARV
jgi:hypothetical protein